MIRRHGVYRRAAFLSVVYSENFSTGAVENTRGTYGYHSPAQVQLVLTGGEGCSLGPGRGERWNYGTGQVRNAAAKREWSQMT